MRTRTATSIAIFTLCLGMLVTAAGGAQAQTGTLQAPPNRPQSEAAPKPPAAAARQPVHQARPHPPVVKPHGATHAQKPAAASKPAAKPPEPPPAVVAVPVKPADGDKLDPAAPKLPRFAALRSDEVNLRAGPGTRYPIEWLYRRRDLPVEIEREFEVWRLVRDMDGIRGWVHQATLTGRRNFIVTAAEAAVRAEAQDQAAALAILKSGVIGRIRSCEAASDWCQVQVAGHRGYIKREQIWGLLPKEAIVQ